LVQGRASFPQAIPLSIEREQPFGGVVIHRSENARPIRRSSVHRFEEALDRGGLVQEKRRGRIFSLSDHWQSHQPSDRNRGRSQRIIRHGSREEHPAPASWHLYPLSTGGLAASHTTTKEALIGQMP
jgi:hypothetical protein